MIAIHETEVKACEYELDRREHEKITKICKGCKGEGYEIGNFHKCDECYGKGVTKWKPYPDTSQP